MKFNSLLVFVFLGMATLTTEAQVYELGLFGGGAYYSGDLNQGPQGQFKHPAPAFGGFIRYNLDNHLSARVNLAHGNVSGTDEGSPFSILENGGVFRFETNITELSVQGEVNFLPYVTGEEESLFSPYLFLGMGYLFFDGNYGSGTKTHLDTAEQPDADNKISSTYLFGGGLKYHITSNISGGMEWGLRRTGTDYLDQVSLRGNPRGNDWYGFAGLILTYKIIDRSSARCPHTPF
ncbi:MAG: DUF6089 family protein [Bacteroidales bacterium]